MRVGQAPPTVTGCDRWELLVFERAAKRQKAGLACWSGVFLFSPAWGRKEIYMCAEPVVPVLIPKDLTKGKDAWIDYASNTQSPALPLTVRVLIGSGELFDVIDVLSGPFESWSDVNQRAAEVANNWYDRGDG